MHTEASDRGWYSHREPEESHAQRARRESADRFYEAKDAARNAERKGNYEEARRQDAIMRQEFFRELPEDPSARDIDLSL